MESFKKLLDIIITLRSENGCPWDKEQTLQSLNKLFLEECYELSDGIQEKNPEDIQEELGDVFFMLLMMGYIAQQEKITSLNQIFDNVASKLINRHPHVFSNQQLETSEEVISNWEALKKTEKSNRNSIFDGIPISLPELMRFDKLMRKLKNNSEDLTEYFSSNNDSKSQLQNSLINLFINNEDILQLINTINKDIEQTARNKGL